MIIPAKTHSQGFTLVEVMVAVVILAIGLLGMATLMMNSLQSNESAYSRSQATLLAYDILDRMRVNKVASGNPAQPFRVTHASVSDDYLLSGIEACAQRSVAGLASWCALLQESMPNLLSTRIEQGDEDATYIITIEWQEAHDSDGDGESDTGTLVVEAQL